MKDSLFQLLHISGIAIHNNAVCLLHYRRGPNEINALYRRLVQAVEGQRKAHDEYRNSKELDILAYPRVTHGETDVAREVMPTQDHAPVWVADKPEYGAWSKGQIYTRSVGPSVFGESMMTPRHVTENPDEGQPEAQPKGNAAISDDETLYQAVAQALNQDLFSQVSGNGSSAAITGSKR